MDLMFTIKDDRIFPYGAESINTGSLNYYKCRFDFNESWNGLSKFAIFKSGNEYYGPQLIEEGSCPVPSEVFQSPGSFFAGVYGTAETGDAVIKRIVTGWCRINVSDGAYNSDTTAPEPPEADVWEEYMAYLGKTIENSVPQIADNGNWLIWDPEEKEYADSGKPSRGIQGETGPQGAQGEKGDKGDKGDTGIQGVQGEKGDTGEPGYTPQRGVDYWTQSDKAAIAEDISAEVVQQTAGMAKISELAALE